MGNTGEPKGPQEPVAWARMKNGKVINAFHDKGVAKFLAGFAASELVPLYMHAEQPATKEQMEVVGWQFYQDGQWWNGDDRIRDHRKNTLEAGFRVRDVYATQQPAQQPAPETVECRKFTFWAVYDATGDRQFVKMESNTGCLAFFGTERQAAAVAADCAGADYKELVLYSCPQPAPDSVLVEAFDAGRRAAQAEAAELAGALDEMIKEADLASWGGYFPATAVTRAVEALAAYRKQGGES